MAFADHAATKAPNRIPIIGRGIAVLTLVPLLAAGCVFDSDEAAQAGNASRTSVTVESTMVRQESIALTSEGFQPDSVEVDEGATFRVRNETGEAVTVHISGGDSDAEYEIPADSEVEVTMSNAGARVITVPGNSGFTASVMVRAQATTEAR